MRTGRVAPICVAAIALGFLSPRAARGEAARDSEAPPAGLVHEAITSGRRGSVLVVTVSVQNELTFAMLVLAYRPDGESDFHGREMKLVAPGTYRAEIPPQGTRGRTVAYYIEARDKDGAPVAGRASAQNPLVIQLAGELQDRSLGKEGDHREEAGEDDEESDGLFGKRLFVGLLVGTGAGWAAGNGDTNADTMYKPSAFAFAGLGQLAPEIGYWLSPTLMVSLQGRFQAVTGTTDVYADGRIYHTANYAAAAFVKSTWLARRPGTAHPFFSLSAGVGQIRHVVTFDSLRACGPSGRDVCVDTIATGPVALGPGAGVFVDIGARLLGVFELDTQLTFPAYSVNVDGDLGLAVRF